eukprot:3232004-Rhodomonas_salina.3
MVLSARTRTRYLVLTSGMCGTTSLFPNQKKVTFKVASPACFSFPMRCPILIYYMALHLCYAMSGTDIGYAATRAGKGW